MSDSSLVSFIKISPHHTSGRRGQKIDSVCIHCMAGNMSVQGCGDWFSNKKSKASSNYGVDSKGRVGMYVHEKDRAWTTCSGGVDRRAVTIEVANTSNKEPYPVSDKAYEALINLLVDICRRNGIPALKWRGDKAYAKRAAAGGPVTDQNMFVHRWFSKKSCPGNYLYGKHSDIANEVNRRLGANVPLQGVVKPSDVVDATKYSSSASSTTSKNASGATQTSSSYGTTDGVTINVSALKPYVITLSENTKLPQKVDMTTTGVVGGVVEAGYLYNRDHSLHNSYVNSQISKQIAWLHQYNLPFGLLAVSRAHTTQEAINELKKLALVVRQYSPYLGLWVQFDSPTVSITKQDEIVVLYQDALVKLGLKKRIGMYLTPKQLQHLTWSKHQASWYLWINDHVSNLSEIPNLLTPEFFDMEGKYA